MNPLFAKVHPTNIVLIDETLLIEGHGFIQRPHEYL